MNPKNIPSVTRRPELLLERAEEKRGLPPLPALPVHECEEADGGGVLVFRFPRALPLFVAVLLITSRRRLPRILHHPTPAQGPPPQVAQLLGSGALR